MPGDQVNLLVVQKQIIADTAALNATTPATNYLELAWRQTNAMELGRLYLATMAGAPAEAVTEMNSAVASMEQAIAPLNRRDRLAAIPPEEAALAHLYRVLALMPEVKLLAVKPKPPMVQQQKPQRTVALREIKKPAPETAQVDPEIEKALAEARELSLAQAELNAIGEKLAKAESRNENTPADSAKNQTQSPQPMAKADAKGQAKAPGQGQGQGEGEGEGQGKGQGQAPGNAEGAGEKPSENPQTEKQFAKSAGTNAKTNVNTNTNPNANINTNRANVQQPPLSLTNKTATTNDAARHREPQTQKALDGLGAEPAVAAKPSAPVRSSPARKNPTPIQTAQIAPAQKSNGEGTKPGKGRGQGKGKAKAAGPKGKGKGQGTKPGDGSGQPSAQQSGEAPEMPAADPDDEVEPDTPGELAQKQEELSAEAKALSEMLRRLAGKGTRVGHNLAVSANKAAEHMEGAAQALKQGNASGAGRRGTMSSAELDQIVADLERLLGRRPDLTDVASEEAPKEYEAFISEYFKKLSYEK
jgi:hypothetical protein